MLCRQCQADLRHVNMQAAWSEGGSPRIFQLVLECPHCGAAYRLAGVRESQFLALAYGKR